MRELQDIMADRELSRAITALYLEVDESIVNNLRSKVDAALRRAKADGLEDALKLCVIIENHYASKRMDTRVAVIQRLAVVGVRKSIAEHLEKGGTSSAGQQCKWKYDDIDDYYETQCDEGYCCNGTLDEHKIKFCPFCGGIIQLDARAAQIEEGEHGQA